MKVLGTELFPQCNLRNLNSNKTFYCFVQTGETFTMKRNSTHTHTHTHTHTQLHSSVIPGEARLVSLSEQLLTEHQKTWKQLQSELNMCACLLGYCKSATIT